MDITIISLLILAFLILLLGSSVWIGISLLLVSTGSLLIFTDTPPTQILADILWNDANDYTMFALAGFIFMGEIMLRSTMSKNLFKGLAPWMALLPGKLFHVNIAGSTLFSAVSGSSAATTATIGKITLQELSARNYNQSLSLGSLAGAGTLGFLIPPSLIMIVYGITANVSIGQLFFAGVFPAILLAFCLSFYIAIRSIINPNLAPEKEKFTWKDRIESLPLFLPIVLLITFVLGSIYTGWATPTESAALGVVGALLFAVISRSMTFKQFQDSILGAIKTTTMIMLIVVSASYLSVVFGHLRIPAELTQVVASLELSGWQLLLILTILYIFMGFFLDGFSIIVMSLPLVLPLIVEVGFSPLWFGIYLVLLIEAAQITPPVGFNLFVISGLSKVDVLRIALYALPSFLIIMLVVIIIYIYPEIVLWLPGFVE
ncbi:TRAP transporter large permease [Natribacillus halophilus]|uniref:TRAP transporter, DctM subunit n=1 Tax=Natribacillus halophilus TaxID=549003 RepID=A0A1G8RBC2_9BACI|nr:TRAP transporter large permease subunit [Natribacillus halophilus]SDJ13680.1 TRAP transporter, DctM subunit [Natribacillus halophilus]